MKKWYVFCLTYFNHLKPPWYLWRKKKERKTIAFLKITVSCRFFFLFKFTKTCEIWIFYIKIQTSKKILPLVVFEKSEEEKGNNASLGEQQKIKIILNHFLNLLFGNYRKMKVCKKKLTWNFLRQSSEWKYLHSRVAGKIHGSTLPTVQSRKNWDNT